MNKEMRNEMNKKTYGIEWVVSGVTAEGVRYRGVQVAKYGHPAIDFFAKKNGVRFVSALCEKKEHFDRFLEQGLRKPL
jgi:hypothetical protein